MEIIVTSTYLPCAFLRMMLSKAHGGLASLKVCEAIDYCYWVSVMTVEVLEDAT